MRKYRVIPALALCLLLSGCGRLSVSSPYGHGIVSKDELTITGGDLSVTAAKHTLDANDSIAVCGGSTGCNISISGGSIKIAADGDGIDSNGSLSISGGDISSGESYSLSLGGSVTQIKMDGSIYGEGGMPGGRPGFGKMPPDMGSSPEGAPPDMGTRPDNGLGRDGSAPPRPHN